MGPTEAHAARDLAARDGEPAREVCVALHAAVGVVLVGDVVEVAEEVHHAINEMHTGVEERATERQLLLK